MSREELGLDYSPNPAGFKSIRADPRASENKTGSAPLQVQSEIFRTLREVSRDWMAYATTEIDLGLELSKKLSAARSVPDAIAAYQEWVGDEMGAHAEDAHRLMSNGQKLVDAGTRLLSNGWMSSGR